MPRPEEQPTISPPEESSASVEAPDGRLATETLTDFDTVVREVTECTDQVARLAANFHQAVSSSGRFSWLGVVERTDELEQPRLAVYLLEDPVAVASLSPQQPQPASVSRVFDPLADALRPQLHLDLYILNGARYSPEAAKVHLEQRNAEQPGNARLIWDEPLLNAFTPVR